MAASPSTAGSEYGVAASVLMRRDANHPAHRKVTRRLRCPGSAGSWENCSCRWQVRAISSYPEADGLRFPWQGTQTVVTAVWLKFSEPTTDPIAWRPTLILLCFRHARRHLRDASPGPHGRIRHGLAAFCAVLLGLSGTLAAAALVGTVSAAGATTPTTVTDTFGFDNGTLQNFTVPGNVSSLTVTVTGGQGGWGGADASGSPPAGGYQGQVSGTIPVTPGDYLTLGVGAGADEPDDTACTGGRDETSPSDPYDAAAGVNPLSQYDGGTGGAPGYNGCSGYGGAGGAASRGRGRLLGERSEQCGHHRGGRWRR